MSLYAKVIKVEYDMSKPKAARRTPESAKRGSGSVRSRSKHKSRRRLLGFLNSLWERAKRATPVFDAPCRAAARNFSKSRSEIRSLVAKMKANPGRHVTMAAETWMFYRSFGRSPKSRD